MMADARWLGGGVHRRRVGAQGNPVLIGEDECFYQFVWPSSEACPQTGLSGGAIFLIVYGPAAGADRARATRPRSRSRMRGMAAQFFRTMCRPGSCR